MAAAVAVVTAAVALLTGGGSEPTRDDLVVKPPAHYKAFPTPPFRDLGVPSTAQSYERKNLEGETVGSVAVWLVPDVRDASRLPPALRKQQRSGPGVGAPRSAGGRAVYRFDDVKFTIGRVVRLYTLPTTVGVVVIMCLPPERGVKPPLDCNQFTKPPFTVLARGRFLGAAKR